MACIIHRSLRNHRCRYFSLRDGMLRCREVHVQRKIVRSEPQIISQVPRPFGELTHPSWRPEDVAFVVLVATTAPRYRLMMRKSWAIAPCAHCPGVTEESGITAGSSLHLRILPILDASSKVVKAFEHASGFRRWSHMSQSSGLSITLRR